MKISVIAPVPLLTQYATMSDNYHLVLSHLVDEWPEYAQFYRQCSDNGDWIILDNSAHEYGTGDAPSKLLNNVERTHASEVILPDRLFFGDDTIRLSARASTFITNSGVKVRQFAVPQGRTIDEWENCLRNLLQLPISTIGISKDYEVWPGGLVGLVELVRQHSSIVDIHMLGWGRDANQLAELSRRSEELRIRGVDSAKPLVYALSKTMIPDPFSSDEIVYPTRPKGFFATGGINPEYARANIDAFRRYANFNDAEMK